MEPNERDVTRHLVEDPWAEQAPSWDSDPVVRAYADAAWSSLRAHGEPRAGARVLDFGCGTGLLSERMAPHVAEVIAVDASPAMVAVLSEKRIPNVRAGVASWTPATIDRDDLPPIRHMRFIEKPVSVNLLLRSVREELDAPDEES